MKPWHVARVVLAALILTGVPEWPAALAQSFDTQGHIIRGPSAASSLPFYVVVWGDAITVTASVQCSSTEPFHSPFGASIGGSTTICDRSSVNGKLTHNQPFDKPPSQSGNLTGSGTSAANIGSKGTTASGSATAKFGQASASLKVDSRGPNWEGITTSYPTIGTSFNTWAGAQWGDTLHIAVTPTPPPSAPNAMGGGCASLEPGDCGPGKSNERRASFKIMLVIDTAPNPAFFLNAEVQVDGYVVVKSSTRQEILSTRGNSSSAVSTGISLVEGSTAKIFGGSLLSATGPNTGNGYNSGPGIVLSTHACLHPITPGAKFTSESGTNYLC